MSPSPCGPDTRPTNILGAGLRARVHACTRSQGSASRHKTRCNHASLSALNDHNHPYHTMDRPNPTATATFTLGSTNASDERRHHVTTACHTLQPPLPEKFRSKKISETFLPSSSKLALLELSVFPCECLAENYAHNDRQSERGDANRVGLGVGESPCGWPDISVVGKNQGCGWSM